MDTVVVQFGAGRKLVNIYRHFRFTTRGFAETFLRFREKWNFIKIELNIFPISIRDSSWRQAYVNRAALCLMGLWAEAIIGSAIWWRRLMRCVASNTRASELFIGKSLVITSPPTTPDTIIYSHLRVRLSSRFPAAVIYVAGCLFELIECLRKRSPSSFLLHSFQQRH